MPDHGGQTFERHGYLVTHYNFWETDCCFRMPGRMYTLYSQLNSTQPDITDAGVNTSISASMYPTF